jgi:hypothetical protein
MFPSSLSHGDLTQVLLAHSVPEPRNGDAILDVNLSRVEKAKIYLAPAGTKQHPKSSYDSKYYTVYS